tara:strand:+ start:8018 stop:8149 length:132 start_codon:yes stop_codon:yes gene_type:complete
MKDMRSQIKKLTKKVNEDKGKSELGYRLALKRMVAKVKAEKGK